MTYKGSDPVKSYVLQLPESGQRLPTCISIYVILNNGPKACWAILNLTTISVSQDIVNFRWYKGFAKSYLTRLISFIFMWGQACHSI